MSPIRVLITSGATREPVDQVRFLTNFSTGQTGAKIAEEFARAGARVHYLAGLGAALPESAHAHEAHSIAVERFESFRDLNARLEARLSQERWDWVIHLAAVGDYSIASIRSASGREIPLNAEKLDSSEDLVLELKRNFKIVGRLRAYAGLNPVPTLVAFKLTNTQDSGQREAAVSKLLEEDIDLVVHNDLSELRLAKRVFQGFTRRGGRAFTAASPTELVACLLDWKRSHS
jgi:phosphopantothenoylcysteine synthetase/decarboxylase